MKGARLIIGRVLWDQLADVLSTDPELPEIRTHLEELLDDTAAEILVALKNAGFKVKR